MENIIGIDKIERLYKFLLEKFYGVAGLNFEFSFQDRQLMADFAKEVLPIVAGDPEREMRHAIDFVLLQLHTYLWRYGTPDIEIKVQEIFSKEALGQWQQSFKGDEIILAPSSILNFLRTDIEEIEVCMVYGGKIEYYERLAAV